MFGSLSYSGHLLMTTVVAISDEVARDHSKVFTMRRALLMNIDSPYGHIFISVSSSW